MGRRAGGAQLFSGHQRQIIDNLACQCQRVIIILGQIVGNTTQPRMGIAATQRFSIDILAGSLFHQRRTGQKDGPLPCNNNRLVRHGRHIGTPGRAGSHDHGNLRNTGCAHPRLIIKNASKMVAVGKHLVLTRQVGTAAIHQIQAGQMVLQRDFLRAKMLFHRQRIVTATLYRGVIADDHAVPPAYLADTGNDPGGRDLILIQVMRRKKPDFQKIGTRIQ